MRGRYTVTVTMEVEADSIGVAMAHVENRLLIEQPQSRTEIVSLNELRIRPGGENHDGGR